MTVTDGSPKLKSDDTYMYQIQGQLHITDRQLCYFIVWTPKGMIVDKIQRDDIFWKTRMETKLINFYKNCLLLEIVDSRKERNLPIRD